MCKISWFKFTLLISFLITLLNFNLFIFVYKNLQNFWLTLGFILGYFALINAIFSLIFVKFLSKFFAVFFIICAGFSAFFMFFYGILIDSDMIVNIVQTDAKEAKELLNLNFFILCLFLFMLCFFVLKIRIVKKESIFKELKFRILSIVLSLLVFLAFFMPFTKTYIPFFRNYKEIRMYNLPFYPLYASFRYCQIFLKPKPEFIVLSNEAFKEDKLSKKLLILVVGETARAENFSLGTYTKNDTNFYTKQEKVVFFENFNSCGTSTAISVPCMFSASKRKDFSNSEFRENALDFLQKLEVSVSWLGNNYGGCKGVCDRILDKKFLDGGFDGNLLEELKLKLANLSTQNLIVLHLQGSHGPTYYKRYPKNFARFTPTCDTNKLDTCSNESLINTYDNTLLYTDFILSEIIKLLKEKKDFKSAMIYLSDHGESLGENGIYLHSMPYFIAPKNQIHIPFIFWSNDENLNQELSQKKSLKLSHDNLFSALLGYFKISTPLYEKEFDIFSSALKANP